MRPTKYILNRSTPGIINEMITKAIHLISANGKQLDNEEIEAIEILLKVCNHLRDIKPVTPEIFHENPEFSE